MMKNNTLYIHVVVWNHAKYLPLFFSSLREQSDKDFVIRIIDNDSFDSTKELIATYQNAGLGLKIERMKNFKNIGFGQAHNQLLKFVQLGQYVAIVNPDMYFPSDFVKNIKDSLSKNPKPWLHSVRLMRCHLSTETLFDEHRVLDINPSSIVDLTNEIDSIGLGLSASGYAFERYAGKEFKPKEFNTDAFGATGACLFFDTDNLSSMAYDDQTQLFHPDFFAYQEDVELAWRIRQRGGDVSISNDFCAYHVRSYKSDTSFFARIISYLKRSNTKVAEYSYKNKIRLFAEHIPFTKYGLATWKYLFAELRFIPLLLMGRFYVLKAWSEVLLAMPKWWKLRKIAKKQKFLDKKDLIAWYKKDC